MPCGLLNVPGLQPLPERQGTLAVAGQTQANAPPTKMAISSVATSRLMSNATTIWGMTPEGALLANVALRTRIPPAAVRYHLKAGDQFCVFTARQGKGRGGR